MIIRGNYHKFNKFWQLRTFFKKNMMQTLQMPFRIFRSGNNHRLYLLQDSNIKIVTVKGVTCFKFMSLF